MLDYRRAEPGGWMPRNVLGDFVELEVVLRDDEDEAHGAEIARELMGALGIAPTHLVDVAYIDLLEAGPDGRR